ncbi:MAG: glutamyl-tRNA reductase [Verrucomicrobiaceae bacterium]|nr:glutamyl-tRNA reductase [Verrucomicrobiaceae bacterium]
MNCSQALYLCGISHENANAEQIGVCGVAKENCVAKERLILEKYGLAEVVLLSTCNRVEYYFVGDKIDVEAFKLELFGDANKLCYFKKNKEVVSHLFEVASGLKSQMTGETEIFGQVKTAYLRSFESNHCGRILNAVFQKSAQVGKWIRTNTEIGHGKISIGSVSAELALHIFEDISKANILLVGSGEAGKLIADALYVRGAQNITIVSRTRENSDKLAKEIGVRSADLNDGLDQLGLFDIVVCASSAGELISCDMVKSSMKKRVSPMFLIDLSVPKNIDENCADLDDVYLYDMKNLSDIASSNMNMRKGEIATAKSIIDKKAEALVEKLKL